MTVGRRRPGPGQGEGINIGGTNNAPLQNVVGQDISHVHQSASVPGGAVDAETVRDLLAAFRAEVDRAGPALPNVAMLRAAADSVDGALAAPETRTAGALRGVVDALPSLVAGTVVQQGGEALAHALAGWLG